MVGAGSCAGAHADYLSMWNGLMDAANGMSPIAIAGTFAINGNQINVSATFMQVDPVALTNVRAAFFIYEDHILYNGQYWDHICRYIAYEPVTTLHSIGDQATVSKTIPVGAWNTQYLHCAVILENASNPKQIYQASYLPSSGIDYSLSVPSKLASVPSGNGTATFPAQLWNLATSGDQVTFAVDQAMGWPTDFQIAGDPNWYTNRTINVPANGTVDLTVRVRTDMVKRIGSGTFTATSANSGRVQPISLRVFNCSPAILFVDDDNGSSYQGVPFDLAFRDALDQNGYLYDWWDAKNMHGNAGPNLGNMTGFDAVIWQTAYQTGDMLRDGEIASLQAYIDGGGKLYLDSMDFLSSTGTTAFTSTYLGLASWEVNTHATTEHGVPGDPISDGLNLTLNWPVSQANRTDTVNPSGNAVAFLLQEGNLPNAVRNTVGANGRVVFSTIPHDVFSASAPDPNNRKIVMKRILEWLVPTQTGSVPESAHLGGILAASPNPLSPKTEISFRVVPGSGPVQLVLTDATGRVVRNLVQAPLAEGAHSASWDGRDDSGRPVPAGVYFARLLGAGNASTKLVVVR